MELEVSSVKSGGLSPDYASDPEEKEVSDEDDDDRNHKHRRRGTCSHSLETDAMEPAYTRMYRKRSKPFENGHLFRENESQTSGTWKSFNVGFLEKDFKSKFERRCHGLVSLSRGPSDSNQRIRSNQTLYGGSGPGRGRGRDFGSWNHRDSRFNSFDVTSQMVQQGSFTPSLFGGGGLPNVSNSQGASWNAFGLVPRISNVGIDTLRPMGFQGSLGPAVNSSISMGIPRPRCRDFEEQGFCMRGDMCPMEHGVNRIVVEDVQSLSQFNLPVSLPSAKLLETPVSSGPFPPLASHLTTSTNGKGTHGKTSKHCVSDASLGLNGTYSGSGAAGGADLYDPDELLWKDDDPETSKSHSTLHSFKNESEPLISIYSSDGQCTKSNDSTDGGFQIRRTGVTVGSQSMNSSVWGRIGSSKDRFSVKNKSSLPSSTSGILEDDKNNNDSFRTSVCSNPLQGKEIVASDTVPGTVDSYGTQSEVTLNVRRPSQKALRTLFVNGIPLKSNQKEALFSHFQKFGKVIDIYIPTNTERAFVQFSNGEEAEAALRAPDAVMGNRFIKLWWANRDNISDDGISSTGNGPVAPFMTTGASVHLHPQSAGKGKEHLQSATPKSTNILTSDASLLPLDHAKPIINEPKVLPPLHKKLELEQLREELRKKQELLEQKRNDFRRQLDKFEKQASGIKAEAVAEPSTKKPKIDVATDGVNATSPRSTHSVTSVVSSFADVTGDKSTSADNAISSSPKTNVAATQQYYVGSKPIPLTAPVQFPFQMNRYKLDNRPTAFRIVSPLPLDLAKVDALKEHFSSFGELSSVELEDVDHCDVDADDSEKLPKFSACVNFTTRNSAEKAFVNGKCWHGKTMQFVWVTSRRCSNDPRGNEISTVASNCPKDGDPQPGEKSVSMNFREASVSRDGDSEILETSIAKHTEFDEISQFKPHLRLTSDHKVSPESEFCLTAMSKGEESCSTVASEESKTSKENFC